MSNKLHKYIEGIDNGSTLISVEATPGEARDFSNFIKYYGPQAMCFDLGDVDQYTGIKPIPELCLTPPFETCYYQFSCKLSNGNVATVGCIEYIDKETSYVTGVIIRDVENCVIRSAYQEYPDGKYSTTPPEHEIFTKNIIHAIRVFRTILNCKNVKTEEIKPDAALQKARARRGKMPLFSYHVLTLRSDTKEKCESKGGTHASPRLHIRRGHIRRFDDGTHTWVSPCTVGDKSLGMVHKDYKYEAQKGIA